MRAYMLALFSVLGFNALTGVFLIFAGGDIFFYPETLLAETDFAKATAVTMVIIGTLIVALALTMAVCAMSSFLQWGKRVTIVTRSKSRKAVK